jgi:hypothetical protein
MHCDVILCPEARLCIGTLNICCEAVQIIARRPALPVHSRVSRRWSGRSPRHATRTIEAAILDQLGRRSVDLQAGRGE